MVNGSHVFVRGVATDGIFSVRMGDKVVLASCLRTAHVPQSVGGAALDMLFVKKYREGKRIDDLDEALRESAFTAEDVHWEDVTYLEASPIIDAIHMLIPASSSA